MGYKCIYKLSYLTLLFIIGSSHLYPQICQAQEKPKLNVTVIPDSGTNDTKFFLQITVSGANISDFAMPTIKDNEDFSVAINSNSVQEQQINGVSSQQKTFVFSLTPKSYLKEGDYTVPNGLVEYRGEKFRLPTKKVHIESAKSFVGSALKSASKDGFNFVQIVSNEKPYVGEQVSYRVEIIAPSNLIKAELDDFQVEGIWRERFGQDEKKQRQAFNLTIHSFSESWFPIQSGVINVPERKLNVALQQVRRVPSNFGLSDQLLSNLLPLISQFSSEEKTVTAPAIAVEVKPLPPPPTPLYGHIPVGKLSVTSSLDKEEGKVGEPLTLTIQVAGDANLKPLELGAPIHKMKDNEIKRYDEKPIIKRVINNPEVYYYKTFSITLIPLTNGNIEIPQFKINWFDPKEEKYKTELTLAKTVSIVGEPLNLPKKEEPAVVTINSEMLRRVYAWSPIQIKPIFSVIIFSISFLLPIIVLIRKLIRNSINRKLNSAKRQIKLILDTQSNSSEINAAQTLKDLKQAASYYLKEDVNALTGAEVARILNKNSPKLETVSKIIDILESSLYAPNSTPSENQKADATKLLEVMYALL